VPKTPTLDAINDSILKKTGSGDPIPPQKVKKNGKTKPY